MLPNPRPCLEEIRPYKPGKPVEQVIRELKLRGPVDKLASNENPMGPSPKALAALRRELKNVYYYPEDSCWLLREKLAKRYKVGMDSVMVGNGSVELILLSCLAYLDPGHELVMTRGSFVMAKIGTRIMNAKLVEVPHDNYCHDLDAMLEAVNDRTRIVYIDNPINPLGTMATKDKLNKFVKELPEHVLLILDEAYAEYITAKKYPNSMNYYKAGRNVLILRTFSKVYGLAGLRVGYGIARPEILQTLGKVRLPFNVSRPAQVAAAAALDDRAHVNRSRRNNEAGKKLLYKEFERYRVFHLPSFANFVFANFPVDSDIVFSEIQQRGVITRPVKEYGFPNALRVSVGTPPQNKRFIKALAEVMKKLHGVS